MTRAVCFNCGEMKFGAFVDCACCDRQPSTDQERFMSLALTDHYFDAEELEKISSSIKNGQAAHLDPQFLDRLEGLTKAPMHRMLNGAEAGERKKRKWWPF